MRIQHNIPAINSYRNYNNNTKALSGNLEKLSSGYKINRAGDDAAGLAISEKMRAQITGLDAAQKNVKDGVSLVKTAEGAMQEIQDMLKRMKYLTTESANGTYQNDVDRDNLQKEVQSLRAEINRIANSANFNGIKLLDGSRSVDAANGASNTSAAQDLMLLANADVDTSDLVAGDAIGTVTPNDGTTADAAGPEVITIKGAVTSSTFEKDEIGNIQVSYGGASVSVSELFEITGTSGNFTLTAKVDGDLDDAAVKDKIAAAVTGATTIAASIEVTTQGKNVDSGDAAGKAKVEFSFGGTIAGGNTVEFGGKTFEFSSSGTTAVSGSVKVDMSLDEDTIANNLKTAMSAQLSNSWDIDVKYENGSFKFTAIAKTAGRIDSSKVGDVKTDIAGGISDYTVQEGSDATSGTSGGYANVTYDIDTTKLAEGDVLQLGDVKLEIAASTDLSKGKISVDDLKTAASAANAFASFDKGNVSFATSGSTVTVTVTNREAGYLGSGFEAFETAATMKHFKAPDPSTTAPGTSGHANTPTLGADKKTYTATVGNKMNLPDFSDDTATLTQEQIDNIKKLTDVYVTKEDKVSFADLNLTANTTTVGQLKNLIETKVTAALDPEKYDISKITIGNGTSATGIATAAAAQNQTNGISISVVSKEEIKDNTGGGTGGDGMEKGPLTLQIGDTGEDFNQMQVSIGDMHTTAMGKKFTASTDEKGVTTYTMEDGVDTIANISINSREDAQAAIESITNAINYVSSVRGDLGAIQNRLDHTLNNLSVMSENITDAESTIRDTDVAEEMMSYVKNNILVQSAQAMLAQANQLPQGVLQLLG